MFSNTGKYIYRCVWMFSSTKRVQQVIRGTFALQGEACGQKLRSIPPALGERRGNSERRSGLDPR